MTTRLSNKTAVITGGTTGLGFETAKEYLAEGAKVLITGRKQATVDEAVSKLGEGAYGLASDVTKLDDLDRLAAKAKEVFLGHVDILFANAGMGNFAPVTAVTEELYNQQFDVNVKGVLFTVQKILPLMKEGGSIILTASGVNAKGAPGASIYFASKAAVRSFARSLAAELGPQGIRVNALSPGAVPTEFQSNTNMPKEEMDGFAKSIVESLPIARFGTPNEIAKSAVFLGSDDSTYMTAADLVVDGGYMNV